MSSEKWYVSGARLAGGVALLSLLAGPAHAVERAKAWVWANQPTAGSYVPDLGYQFNSTGAVNHVTRDGKGRYLVDLPGLETASGGVVQVTAYGGSHHCKVLKWVPIGTALRVSVRCFAGAVPANGRFTLLFYQESRASTVWSDAYLWADRPKAPAYTPSRPYQWNSKGQVNTIERRRKGEYSAKLPGTTGPGVNAGGGTVLVTAYGPSKDRCKVASWFPSGSDTLVDVRCFGPNGAKVDTRFTLSFMTDVALGVRFSEDADYGGYAWAHNPTSDNYVPSPTYSENNAGSLILAGKTAGSTGSYWVRFGLLKPADKTTALVTAYGPNSEFCTVAGWGSDGVGGTIAYVNCFTSNRDPVDTRFTLLYLTDEQILF